MADPPGQPLATLLHISDLHIGHIFHKGGYDAQVEWYVRHHAHRLPWLSGFLGHDQNALLHLVGFHRELLKETEAVLVVATGDLTRNGHRDQYALARDFLRARAKLARFPIGLDDQGVMERTIPGNHDHWPGLNWLFGRPDVGPGRRPFDPLPAWVRPGSCPAIELVRIDTDADVWSGGPFRRRRLRLRAIGSFETQIDHLRRHLPPKPADVALRVLLMHHSPAQPGTDLSVEDRSRRALNELLVDKEIGLVLTGHVHVPCFKLEPCCTGSGSRFVVEARCGTTTQRDTWPMPNGMRHPGQQQLPRLEPNILLVHRLRQDGGELWLHSAMHERTAADGFGDPASPLRTHSERLA